MALTDGENNGIPATMLVGPTNYPVNNGIGNGFGGDGWWIILILLLCGNGGWGGFGGYGMGGFAADGAMLYPWMNQAEITTQGFQNQNLQTGVQNLSTQICGGFSDVQQALCNGFAGVNATVNSGFAGAEASANARQMANMQQAFGLQSAMSNGFNQIGSQFADCCCENRLGIADLKYTVATENCADRAALSDGLRDVLTANTANTQAVLNTLNNGIQSIKDQLCQDKIDAKNDTIDQLRSELMYSRGQASQDVQTARLLAGQTAEVDALYNRLATCPVGTMPVYGNQPIFTCNNNGCGCGA